jgi:hypothetical protein
LGSEWPARPWAIASSSTAMPTTQVRWRGRRKAPVKKLRHRCSTIAATNTSEAQWWVWRTSSPAGTSKEIRITELNASVTGWPRSGT